MFRYQETAGPPWHRSAHQSVAPYSRWRRGTVVLATGHTSRHEVSGDPFLGRLVIVLRPHRGMGVTGQWQRLIRGASDPRDGSSDPPHEGGNPPEKHHQSGDARKARASDIPCRGATSMSSSRVTRDTALSHQDARAPAPGLCRGPRGRCDNPPTADGYGLRSVHPLKSGLFSSGCVMGRLTSFP